MFSKRRSMTKQTIEGRRVQVGDTVELETGKKVKVREVSNGIYRNSVMIQWGKSDDWSHVGRLDTVAVWR